MFHIYYFVSLRLVVYFLDRLISFPFLFFNWISLLYKFQNGLKYEYRFEEVDWSGSLGNLMSFY